MLPIARPLPEDLTREELHAIRDEILKQGKALKALDTELTGYDFDEES